MLGLRGREGGVRRFAKRTPPATLLVEGPLRGACAYDAQFAKGGDAGGALRVRGGAKMAVSARAQVARALGTTVA
jgi:hypothetical protein